MKINLLVIRTQDPKMLKTQYESLGFRFEYHQHGNGPFHYASETNGLVFEIYPLKENCLQADSSIRLGFDIENLKEKIVELRKLNWKVIRDLSETRWGLLAVVQDTDGRKVELKNV